MYKPVTAMLFFHNTPGNLTGQEKKKHGHVGIFYEHIKTDLFSAEVLTSLLNGGESFSLQFLFIFLRSIILHRFACFNQ